MFLTNTLLKVMQEKTGGIILFTYNNKDDLRVRLFDNVLDNKQLIFNCLDKNGMLKLTNLVSKSGASSMIRCNCKPVYIFRRTNAILVVVGKNFEEFIDAGERKLDDSKFWGKRLENFLVRLLDVLNSKCLPLDGTIIEAPDRSNIRGDYAQYKSYESILDKMSDSLEFTTLIKNITMIDQRTSTLNDVDDSEPDNLKQDVNETELRNKINTITNNRQKCKYDFDNALIKLLHRITDDVSKYNQEHMVKDKIDITYGLKISLDNLLVNPIDGFNRIINSLIDNEKDLNDYIRCILKGTGVEIKLQRRTSYELTCSFIFNE